MDSCAGCGEDLVKDARFCHHCGRPVMGARTEQFTVDSEEVVQKVKELIHEGNVTRITVRDEKGRVLLDLPITIGVVGVVLAPLLAAAGAVAAVATKCTLTIERKA
jgi:uncharacterized membrane protein YvbJ